MKTTITELQALQNAAGRIGLTIHEYFEQDKRKSVQKYFATTKEGNKISPVLDYEQLNHFLLGFIKGSQLNKN